MKKTTAILLTALAIPVFAAETKVTGTLIDFQAQAQRTAPNDLGRAVAYFETNSAHPADLANKVNTVIAAALVMAKNHPAVKVRTGSSQTFPIYAKNSRSIESWRMRSELLLESRDAAALSELVGKLQSSLAVGNIGFAPAPETRRKIEDDTAVDAIGNFSEKALRYASSLKKRYRIVSMNIGTQGAVSPAPSFRAMAMVADSAPMPVEAGESQITVTVNGQIELTD